MTGSTIPIFTKKARTKLPKAVSVGGGGEGGVLKAGMITITGSMFFVLFNNRFSYQMSLLQQCL